jgi:hypothetical protein
MPLRILIVQGTATPTVAEAIRREFPAATLVETEETDMRNLSGVFELVVIRCEDNAGFARVRLLRHYLPQAAIVVVGERDRSGGAYMAGANAFVIHYDSNQLTHAIKESLGNRPETNAAAGVADVVRPHAALGPVPDRIAKLLSSSR